MYVCVHRGESVHPYCERVKNGGLQTECTQQRDAMALCNLIEYDKSLPAQYQVAALYIIDSQDLTTQINSIFLFSNTNFVCQSFIYTANQLICINRQVTRCSRVQYAEYKIHKYIQ